MSATLISVRRYFQEMHEAITNTELRLLPMCVNSRTAECSVLKFYNAKSS
jgi:hypothetical protein